MERIKIRGKFISIMGGGSRGFEVSRRSSIIREIYLSFHAFPSHFQAELFPSVLMVAFSFSPIEPVRLNCVRDRWVKVFPIAYYVRN